MKYTSLIITIFLCLSCSSIKTPDPIADNVLTVYKYLLKELSNDLVVSDNLANFDIVNFSELIAEEKKQEMPYVIDSLSILAKKNKYDDKAYHLKKLLNNYNSSGDLKLFFSLPTKDNIVVEVFEDTDNSNYDKLTMFGSSTVYMFLCKNNEIKNEYKITIDYN